MGGKGLDPVTAAKNNKTTYYPCRLTLEPQNHWVVEENGLPPVNLQVPCEFEPWAPFNLLFNLDNK